MKTSFNSVLRDPFVRELLRYAALLAAVVLAAIGIKMIRDYFKR